MSKALWGTLTAVAAVLIGYVALAFWTGRSVPAGTHVAGIDIGSMSRDEAVKALDEGLAERAQEPVALSAGEDSEAEFSPDDVSLGFSAEDTVDELIGPRFNPVDIFRALSGSEHDKPLALEYDQSALDTAAKSLAEDLSVEPKNAELAFSGEKPEVTESADGREVTADSIVEAIETQWPAQDGKPLNTKAETVEPDITDAEAQKAKTEIAEPAVASPVTLKSTGEKSGESLKLSPEAIAKAASFTPRESKLALELDGKALKGSLFKENKGVGEKAQNASFEFSGGKLTVVPSKDGISAKDVDVAKAVDATLKAENRTAELPLTAEKASFTTDDAKNMKMETMGKFSTPYSSQAGRDTNLKVASAKVDGTVVQPGEQFSLNKALGQRTAANGYRKAGVISGGEMKEDYGGGVSQVSTTLFNAAFFSGMQLDEHKAHSRYISRYPEGRESTLDWHSIDMAFTNTSDKPVVLHMSVSGGKVNAEIKGEKTLEVEAGASGRFAHTSPATVKKSGPSCKPQSPRGGWSITIYRTMKNIETGKVTKDQFTTVYRPVNRIVCD